MAAPAWLTARPIAHRGLHDRAAGRVENSLGAARAAIAAGLAIECDVQRTADGEAVVFHDAELDRLTQATGRVADRTAAALGGVVLGDTSDTVPTLAALLELIGGRVPLICEIKTRFDGDLRLAERVRDLVGAYHGPVALKSFDPAPIAHLRLRPPCPLGIVAEAAYTHAEYDALPAVLKTELAEVLHWDRTQPDFLSYHVDDLPHAVPFLCRRALGCPVMAWTVRTPAQRERAAAWADQMVFEGFRP